MSEREYYQINVYGVSKIFAFAKQVYDDDTYIPFHFFVPDKMQNLIFFDDNPDKHFIKKEKGSCHLFKQFEKRFPNENISRALIILNFDFVTEDQFNKFGHCTYIEFENIKDPKHPYIFKDFLKSSSMAAKQKQIYYLRNEFYDEMFNAVTLNIFDLYKNAGNDNKCEISKFYSATGLMLSSCTILDNVKFLPEEICVIKDFESDVQAKNVITCISIQSIDNEINDLNDAIKRFEHSDRIKNLKSKKDLNEIFSSSYNNEILHKYENLMAYINSEDFETLSNDLDGEKILQSLKPFINSENTFTCIKKCAENANNIIKKEEHKPEEPFMAQWHSLTVHNYWIKVNSFDGEGLVSDECSDFINEEYINANKKYTNKIVNDDTTEETLIEEKKDSYFGSMQIRAPFIKGVVHTASFKQFFKDKGVDTISGLTYLYYDKKNKENYRPTKTYNVDKLKLILTESQLKFIKPKILTALYKDELEKHPEKDPIDLFFQDVYDNGFGLGIGNVDPEEMKTAPFNREFLSTIPVSDFNKDGFVNTLLKNANEKLESFDSIEKIKNNLKEKCKLGDFYKKEYELIQADPEFFYKCALGKEFIDKEFSKIKKDILLGKIHVDGKRFFLSGDLLHFLYGILKNNGIDDKNEEPLSTHRFFVAKEGNNFIRDGFSTLWRCPHYARNEIVIAKRKLDGTERQKYFSKLKSTIMVNGSSLIMERLSGADADGDEIFLYSGGINGYIKESIYNEPNSNEGKTNEECYKYPLPKIPALKKGEETFKMDNKVRSWKIGFKSEVGMISNSAFKYSFIAYDNKNDSIKDKNIMASYTLLSGLTIDSKKTGIIPYQFKEQLNIKSGFAYDYLKHKERDTLDKLEVKDKKYNKENSILFRIVKEVKDKKPKKIKAFEKSKYSLSDVKPSDNPLLMKRASIKYIVYRTFNDYKNKRSINAKLHLGITNFLNFKLEKYKVVFHDFYSIFEVKNPRETLTKYRSSKKKWHFLADIGSKIEFLKGFDYENNETLKLLNKWHPSSDLDSIYKDDEIFLKALKVVCDFENDGYKTLYLLLQCQLHNYFVHILEHVSDDNMLFNLNQYYNLCYKDKNDDDEEIEIKNKEQCQKEADRVLREVINEYQKSDRFDLEAFLNEKFKDITIREVVALKPKFKDYPLLCRLFYPQIINYLKEGK